MEKILELWERIYFLFKEKWKYFVGGVAIIVAIFLGFFAYVSFQKAEEEELKSKFDTAYFSYLNSPRDTKALEQNFQNFLNTLQEISATGKNYKIVDIANIILGDIYYNDESRGLDTALTYYSRATNSQSEFLRLVAIFNVAQTYEATGRFEEALKTYELIYKNYPNSFLAPVSVVKSAEIYYYLGNSSKTREMYTLFTNKYSNSQVSMIADLIDLVLHHR